MEDGRPWGGRRLTLLKPDGWFEEGHKEEHICSPPTDAYFTLEFLQKLVKNDCTHSTCL